MESSARNSWLSCFEQETFEIQRIIEFLEQSDVSLSFGELRKHITSASESPSSSFGIILEDVTLRFGEKLGNDSFAALLLRAAEKLTCPLAQLLVVKTKEAVVVEIVGDVFESANGLKASGLSLVIWHPLTNDVPCLELKTCEVTAGASFLSRVGQLVDKLTPGSGRFQFGLSGDRLSICYEFSMFSNRADFGFKANDGKAAFKILDTYIPSTTWKAPAFLTSILSESFARVAERRPDSSLTVSDQWFHMDSTTFSSNPFSAHIACCEVRDGQFQVKVQEA